MDQQPHTPADDPSGPSTPSSHPLEFDVEYPERDLNRLTTFFRAFTVIPIAIVLGAIEGGSTTITTAGDTT